MAIYRNHLLSFDKPWIELIAVKLETQVPCCSPQVLQCQDGPLKLIDVLADDPWCDGVHSIDPNAQKIFKCTTVFGRSVGPVLNG